MAYTLNQPESFINEQGVPVHRIVTNTGTITPLNTTTFFPVIGEKGSLDLNYTGTDTNGAGKIVRKIVSYRRNAAGVISIDRKDGAYSPTPDTGFTGLDVDAIVSDGGTGVTVTIVGIAGKIIAHHIQFIKNFSIVNLY